MISYVQYSVVGKHPSYVNRDIVPDMLPRKYSQWINH